MNLTKFKLLAWKNVRLRRFHWIVTSIEFLLPILVAYLLTRVASSLTETSTSKKNVTIFPTIPKEVFLFGLNETVTLYYAPSNPAIDGFMDEIKTKFESVVGFANETELEVAVSKAQHEFIIGISFNNILSKESLPDKLSYTLRDTNVWNTRYLYPYRGVSGPIFQNPYHDYNFAAVQLVLNENFIKMKTKQDELPEVCVEWFPYPEYVFDSSPRVMISIVAGMFVILTILILSIPLINDIIEEKDSGVKELMKISGLSEWMIWSGWFVHGIVISIITFPIVTWILTYPFSGTGSEAIRFVQYSVLLSFIILYCVSNVSFCFMFSSIFHKAGIASSVFLICFGLLFCGIGYLAFPYDAPKLILQLLSLTPIGAFLVGLVNIQYYEVEGIKFSWSSIIINENDGRISLLFCMGMLALDTFLYFFLTYYFTSINPGQYGTRKSPLFICEGLVSRYCFKRNHQAEPTSVNSNDDTESRYFESPPSNLESTIEIQNLHKRYGTVHAVNGVNLKAYPGEMVALLGHNGAGKTTTMSMLTGLTSPSFGTVRFKKIDIFENMETFRQRLGMCPQENRTMPYLTVMDHLMFFGQLRGVSSEEAMIEANEYLTMMEMQSKKNALAKQLSGGMKRKLCLSIALMGKAEVIILDEPTSGMDVQSRRKLWDLLLDMRGKRTIIFTTHYMEEADALGDRIAIMNHGKIVCHGTPMFLKKAYDTGYELTITKNNANSQKISEIIRNILPMASLESETSIEIVYKLPLNETHKFTTLFAALESKSTELGIENVGVAATTMEQVFLKVGGISAQDAKPTTDARASNSSNIESGYPNYVEGLPLIIQQIAMLFKKKFWFTKRNLFSILTRIVIPTFIGVYMLSLLPNADVDFSPEPALKLSMTTYPSSTVVWKNDGDTSQFGKYLLEYVTEEGGSLIDAKNPDIVQELLEQARDIFKYNQNFISAFELNSTAIKIMNNPRLLHSLPITITTYSNVLLRSITNGNLYEIETFNHPVQKSYSTDLNGICEPFNELALAGFYFLWFCALAFYTVDLMSYFSSFINMERIDGFYHIQMMSKVSPFLYWSTTVVFDLMLFLFVVSIRLIIFKIIDYSNFLIFDTHIGVLTLIIVLYGISGLLFICATSYLSNSKGGSYTLLFIFNLICGYAVSIYYEVEKRKLYEDAHFFYKILFYIAKYVILLVPSLNFSLLFIRLMVIFNVNAICSHCSEVIRPLCEAVIKKKSYLEFPSEKNTNGLLLGITFLLIDILLYATILSLINTGYVRHWFGILKNSIFGTETSNNDKGDEYVQQELRKVQQLEKDSTKHQAALLVNGLRKNYINRFKPFTAVSNVNFVVKPGECYGLLGVNGAGKSTTFKMLTGEILPTLGDSSIKGIKLSSEKIQYLSMAGYCPQTNSFIEVLTGREMLTMIAALRGIPKNENNKLVDMWIHLMGLEEFQNKRCGTYSGGNKRKLCAAMSLIGDPAVVFLDEPTSGVDPVSRRNLYDVMRRSKNAGQAVILTSHSMEECETLCERITIMVAGVMKCIGTAQHLKKIYAQGFSALIKIKDIPDFINRVHLLKQDILHIFSSKYCVLKDEHRGLLYYQIKDTSLSWSTLFDKMEAIKNIHRGLMEDYVLTDTTLEEVFMSFAKETTIDS